jgi:hypothetical protein
MAAFPLPFRLLECRKVARQEPDKHGMTSSDRRAPRDWLIGTADLAARTPVVN